MNFWGHTIFNIIVFSVLAIYLSSHGYIWIEVVLFWLHSMAHTAISPDIDHAKSKPAKMLGLLGKITSKFKHRGILHNPFMWTIVYGCVYSYVFETYDYEAWWITGGLLSLYSHIIVDKLSTGVKRVTPW